MSENATHEPQQMPSSSNEISKSSSSFQIFTQVFVDPQSAFNSMKISYPIVVPLLLLLAIDSFAVFYMFSSLDFAWYVDYIIELSAGDISKAEKDQMRQGMEMMGTGGITAAGIIGVFVMNALLFVTLSAYLTLVSNVNNYGYKFGQWFSIIIWSHMPALIATLSMIVVIATSDNGQIAPESVSPLSLNALFFDMNPVKGVGNILASTQLTMFWTIALMVFGFSQWTKQPVVKSSIIILTPYIIYFGIRFLIA